MGLMGLDLMRLMGLYLMGLIGLDLMRLMGPGLMRLMGLDMMRLIGLVEVGLALGYSDGVPLGEGGNIHRRRRINTDIQQELR